MPHIIVEGMDGSGKTTLIDALIENCTNNALPGAPEPFFVKHRKASTSVGGPVAWLDQWVQDDMNVSPYMAMPTIYDRHPLVSELIYGPICRNRLPGRFNDKNWVAHYRRRLIRMVSVTIFCNPGFETIATNVTADPSNQMDGVVRERMALYTEYAKTADRWPGMQMRYNYTTTSVEDVIHALRKVFPQMGYKNG